MTRVVFLANSVTELGGAQRVVHMLAQELALRGHDVTVVGILPSERPHTFVAEPAYRQVTVLSRALPPPVPAARRARLSPALRRRASERAMLRQAAMEGIAAELASGPPGVVIGAQVWALEHLAEAPARLVDPRAWRVIAQYHGSFTAAATGRDLARLLRTCSGADAFTALTSEDARAFRVSGMNNVVTMPNPLPFWPAAPAAGRARRLLFLGRLAVEKAPGLLLDAWQRISADVPSWSLDLIGSGPLQEQIAAAAGAVPRAQVLPPVQDSQPVLHEAGAFVLPSLTEGSPLALVEAMACGLPVIATDCSAGVRELVIDGQTGLLVRSADPGALADGMLRLLSSADLRVSLGAQARRHVADRKMSRIVDGWERLLGAVLR